MERFALNGEDTTINNIVYKKLYLFYDTVFNSNSSTYFGGIREDSFKRVYFRGETTIHDFKPMNSFYNYEEIVLYDFSLEVNDTIQNINCRPHDDVLIVDDIDTIQIGNTLRKMYHFKNYFWVKWIEGIGNTGGLLFTSGDLPLNGLSGNLICFKKDNEILYFNNAYSECMPLITSIKNNNNELQNFSIYPNPATQNINIIFPTTVTGKFKVYSAIGKLVYTTQLVRVKEAELTLPCLNSGLYYATLTTGSNRFYSKLIIN